MATKRFCDICDSLLTEEDDKPFIRSYPYTENTVERTITKRAVGHIMIMNEQNHVLTDVCTACKLHIVNEGTIVDEFKEGVATLQPVSTLLPLQPSLQKPPFDVPNPEKISSASAESAT